MKAKKEQKSRKKKEEERPIVGFSGSIGPMRKPEVIQLQGWYKKGNKWKKVGRILE